MYSKDLPFLRLYNIAIIVISQTFTLTIGWRRFLCSCSLVWILLHATLLTLIIFITPNKSSFPFIPSRKYTLYTITNVINRPQKKRRFPLFIPRRWKKVGSSLSRSSRTIITYPAEKHPIRILSFLSLPKAHSRGIRNLYTYLEHYNCFSIHWNTARRFCRLIKLHKYYFRNINFKKSVSANKNKFFVKTI